VVSGKGSAMASDLTGQVALVTGGGTGLGRALSPPVAAAGMAVAVTYSRSADAAEATVADLRAAGRKALAIQADVADDAQVRAMVDRTASELGRIDLLVNNAGMTVFVP